MLPAEEWVTIAQLVRPRGNRGEVQARSLSDSPGRFESLSRVFLFRDEMRLGEFRVEHVWWHGETLVLKFSGVDSISAAAGISNTEMRVPFEERAPLESGAYYRSDLIGCGLFGQQSGEPIGLVTGWEEAGGPLLLKIDEDWLVPFTPAICTRIDVAGRRITVDLPEGLKELNKQ